MTNNPHRGRKLLVATELSAESKLRIRMNKPVKTYWSAGILTCIMGCSAGAVFANDFATAGWGQPAHCVILIGASD